MPKLLAYGHKTPKDQLLEILDRISAKTSQKDAKRFRELMIMLRSTAVHAAGSHRTAKS
jgi:hypothetical protein